MIQRVYEQTSNVLPEVYVATDDKRIVDCVKSFGGRVVMTSTEHASGTDRCFEAASILHKNIPCDIVINIQGDEPFLDPAQISTVQACFQDPNTEIATLIKPIDTQEELWSEHVTKAITDKDQFARYFSRSPLPHIRGVEKEQWLQQHTYYKHIGIYAYRFAILKKICALPQSSLEKAESLEQNRWLENGYRIKTAITHKENIAIDTPDDLAKIKHAEKR